MPEDAIVILQQGLGVPLVMINTVENDRKFMISWNLVDSSQKGKNIPMPWFFPSLGSSKPYASCGTK